MSLPGIILGIVVATFIGVTTHYWRNGGSGKLIFFIIFAQIGFWLGHNLGGLLGFSFIRIGAINMGVAVIISILLVAIGNWFAGGYEKQP